MNETKWHLPWRVDLSSWDVVDDNGDEVVHVASRYPDVEAAEVLRLMAAAPETAEKLRALAAVTEELLAVVMIQNGNLHADINEMTARARAALARARGA